MPTSYTADVQSGKTTELKDFVMRCARAFGALIEMRDEPLDAEIPEFEPSSHNSDAAKNASERLAEFKKWTDDEWRTAAQLDFDRRLEEYNRMCERKAEERTRYSLMLAKVNEWQPPSDEHTGLKKFMQDQLNESIDFDCRIYGEKPHLVPVEEFKQSAIAAAESDIDWHQKQHEAEAERAKGRNEWVRLLRESLT